jgi:hypothetical protein
MFLTLLELSTEIWKEIKIKTGVERGPMTIGPKHAAWMWVRTRRDLCDCPNFASSFN